MGSESTELATYLDPGKKNWHALSYLVCQGERGGTHADAEHALAMASLY